MITTSLSLRLVSGVLALVLAMVACNTSDPEFSASIFPERIAFRADRQYPEGITYSPTLDKFLISSMTRGRIGTVDQHGRYADLLESNRLISGVGIRVHEGKLYVCNSDLGVSVRSTAETTLKLASLLVFDLATRQLLKAVRLDTLLPQARHFVNDIAFDRQGNAYITDSYAPVIYKVTPDYQPSVFLNSPLFDGEGVNLNGIVYHPGNFLIVSKTNEGSLFKVDIQRPGIVESIKGVTMPDGDGLTLYNNDLYVVNGQNKVSKLRSTDNWATASVIKTDTIGYSQATANVEVKGRIYTLNARIGELFAAVSIKDTNRLKAAEYSIKQFDLTLPK